jgi:hypothetical protein
MKKIRLLFVFLTLLAAISSAVAQNQIIKAGKKGQIVLSEETKVADVTLKPGHYQIQHRDSGSDHFVQFIAFKGHTTMMSSNPATPSEAGEIKCSVEPLAKKAKQTAVYTTNNAGERRITRVEIAGESVAHVF